MKILLIEDNPTDKNYIEELIRSFRDIRSDLITENTVGKALKHFTDEEVGVIILDLNLPDSSGLDTFRTVNRLAGHIPIIILSGMDDDGLALRAVEEGAQDYLLKGEIGVRVLQKAVQYSIERHRTLRELKKTAFQLMEEEKALKDSQKQLRISENLYRTLFMTVGAATAILDEEGTIIFANADFEPLFGFPPAEAVGKVHWFQFIPPDDLPQFRDYWHLLHEDSDHVNQRYESRLVDRWGRIKYGIISAKLIPQTHNCVMSITDITERKRSEEALQESEVRFRELFDRMSNGVAVYQAVGGGEDFIIQDFNKAAERMEGVSREEIFGRRVTEVFPRVKDLGLLEVFQRVWKTGMPEYLPSAFHEDGEELSTWRENWVYKLPSGEVVAVHNDITERKRAEKALLLRENTLHTLMNAPMDVITLLDARGNILAINDTGAQSMGTTAKGLIGVNINDLFPPTNARNRVGHLNRVVESGEPVEFEDERRGKYFLNRMYPIFNPQHTVVEQVAVFVTDITERRKAEKELRESEERQRLLLEYSGLGIAYWDYSGTLLFLNRKAAENMGGSAAEFAGKRIVELFPIDVARVYLERIASMRGESGIREYEDLVPLLGGDRWFISTFTNVRDTDGQPLGVQIISQDITDRKRVEKALQESEERYRAVVESQTELITRFNPDFTVTFVNDAYCTYFSISRDEIIGKHFKPVIPEEDHDLVKRHFASLNRDAPVATVEHRIVMPDGQLRWQKWVDRAIYNENGILVEFQSVGRDTTEQRNADEALKNAKEYAENLIQTANTMVVVLDSHGNITHFNPAGEKITGYTLAELEGRNWFEVLVPKTRYPHVWEEFNRLLSGGLPGEFENPIITKDGEERYISWRNSEMRESGVIRGTLSFGLDITERKRAEQALRESEEKYRSLVERATDGIAILQDGIVRFVNQNQAQFWGGKPEEIIGRPFTEFIHPGEHAKVQERYQKRLSGEKVASVYETVLVRKNGNSFPAELSAGLISYQGKPADLVLIRDITERKRADEALRESEARLKAVVDGSPIPQFVIGKDHHILYWNRALEELSGIPASEIVGTAGQWKAFYPEKRPILADLVVEGVTSQISEWYKSKVQASKFIDRAYEAVDFFPNLHEGGGWLYFTAAPVIDAGGSVIGAVETLEDITDRKRAEMALRESEERYRTVIETANEAIVVAQDGILKFVNPRAVEMLQSTPDYISNVPFAEFIHPDDRDMVVERYKRRISGENIPSNYDFRFVGKQGRMTWVHISAVRITWGGRPATLNFLMDVTERRKMEQALKDSEEMFRNPVEQSPVGVYLFQDGAVRYTNQRLSEIFGYPHEESTTLTFERVIHPDDLQKVMEEIARWMKGEAGPKTLNIRGMKKDGTPVDIEVYSSNMLYQGRPATYGTVIDITERNRLENQIRDSLKEKEVLLREIHHRVKNNMQVISSLLSVQSQNISDEGVRGVFKESQNRIRSIALVHELLYRSDKLDQIEYGAYLKKMFVPLFESYSIDQRKVAMEIEARDTMITIERAVPCSLIVNELISNSLKHAFPKNRKGEIRISFSLDRGAGKYILDYRDNGVGIPADLDPEACTTLGMRLIHGLTRQLQGTIEVKNQGGAHFHITFPAENSPGGSL